MNDSISEGLTSSPSVYPRRWAALGVLAAAQFMVILDVTIVNVALPAIRADLHFAPVSLQWVLTAYTLLFGGFLLLGGRAADLLGRRRMFLAGLVLFAGASLLGGLASSEIALVGARAIQGLGAAMLSPAALSLVTTLFPAGRDRNRALGVFSSLAGLGGTVGVVAGGLLVDGAGWRWVFFVNVPVALLVAPLALRLLPEAHDRTRSRRFDLAGALSSTAGVMVLVYAVISTDSHAWTSAFTLGLLALSGALLGLFVTIEGRSSAPLIPLRLFSSRTFAVANLALLLNGATFVAMFFLTTLSMQDVLGFSALSAGLGFVPMGIAVIGAANLASRLVTRWGGRPVYLAGTAIAALGIWLLSQIHAGGSYASDVLPGVVVFGLGLPLTMVPNTIAALSTAPAGQSGTASGIANAFQQIGGAIGLSALVTVATSATTNLLSQGMPGLAAVADGFSVAFTVAAGIAVANMALALVLSRNNSPGEPVPAISDVELAALPG